MKIRDQKRKKKLQLMQENKPLKVPMISYRYLLTVAYDGSKFGGYAKQKFPNTIQNNLEVSLKKILNEDIKTCEASRTDSGVHSLDQKVMFDSKVKLDCSKFNKQLNNELGNYIDIFNVKRVDKDFHARYNVSLKTYEYRLTTKRNPCLNDYAWYYNGDLDFVKIDQLLKILKGEHDFKAFCNSKATTDNFVRNIKDISYCIDQDDIVFSFKAKGFLYNMIRIFMRLIVDVGSGKIEQSLVEEMFITKVKPVNLETAPANGLTLVKIDY